MNFGPEPPMSTVGLPEGRPQEPPMRQAISGQHCLLGVFVLVELTPRSTRLTRILQTCGDEHEPLRTRCTGISPTFAPVSLADFARLSFLIPVNPEDASSQRNTGRLS